MEIMYIILIITIIGIISVFYLVGKDVREFLRYCGILKDKHKINKTTQLIHFK